jgi:hypothetical protein
VTAACVWLTSSLVYGTVYLMPMGQTDTVNITESDYMHSEPLQPPFRLQYFAYTNSTGARLDFYVLESSVYTQFITQQVTSPTYVQGLSVISSASASVLNNYNGGETCYLVILIDTTYTKNSTATVTYRYDYLQLYWGLSSWAFGVVTAVVCAVLVIVFIVMTSLLFRKFIIPRCRR